MLKKPRFFWLWLRESILIASINKLEENKGLWNRTPDATHFESTLAEKRRKLHSVQLELDRIQKSYRRE
jgi:hypothetical protein